MSTDLKNEFELGTAHNPDLKQVDPENSNQVKHGNGSTIGAYFNLINALAGSGTLGLPTALAQSGWIGMGFILISAFFCIYTGNLLVKCMNAKSKTKIESYPDVGYAAFGIPGRLLVQFCQYSIICGGVTLYLVLSGTNIGSLAKLNGFAMEKRYWICIAGLIVWIPFAFLKTIQEVAFISFFGTIATIVTVIISVTLGLLQLPNLKDINHSDANLFGIPLALTTIAFSYGGTVVYPHVYRSMKNPRHWNYVMTAATFTAMILYVLMAGVCYYVFGENVQSPIFEDLPDNPAKYIAVIGISIHVLAASPVFLCSFSLEIERWLNINVQAMGKTKELAIRICLRSFIVAVLIAIGNLVPYFGNLMSLIGAISECMLIFLVPLFCHLKLFGVKGRPFYEYIWITIIVIVAIVCVIFGSIDAVKGLIKDFNNDPSKL